MDDEILYELGTDFDSGFKFNDGDLQIISYDKNLVQSLVNRFNTQLNELDLFYNEYGSVLLDFLGWKANEDTLQFIQSEIETVLNSEERILSYEIKVSYEGNGKIKIDLTLYPTPDYSIDTTLIVDNEGVTEEEGEEEE